MHAMLTAAGARHEPTDLFARISLRRRDLTNRKQGPRARRAALSGWRGVHDHRALSARDAPDPLAVLHAADLGAPPRRAGACARRERVRNPAAAPRPLARTRAARRASHLSQCEDGGASHCARPSDARRLSPGLPLFRRRAA
ncbi:MAG: hypothetical protein AAGM38_15670 [Pseudomonadota bacterium]